MGFVLSVALPSRQEKQFAPRRKNIFFFANAFRACRRPFPVTFFRVDFFALSKQLRGKTCMQKTIETGAKGTLDMELCLEKYLIFRLATYHHFLQLIFCFRDWSQFICWLKRANFFDAIDIIERRRKVSYILFENLIFYIITFVLKLRFKKSSAQNEIRSFKPI